MGSEVKLWRDLLTNQEVPNVALSYIGLRRRIQDTAAWEIEDHYPQFQEIFLDSGAFTLNKEGSEYTREQALELSSQYEQFAADNAHRLSLISEFDAHILGYDYIQARREDFYNDLDSDKFMPVWHPSYGLTELDKMASSYSVIGIANMEAGDNSLLSTLNSLVNRYGVRLHGVAMTGRKMMKQVKWDSVASMSWISPTRFGDTIVWTAASELKRYPKDYKEEGRTQHKSWLAKNGFDNDKILADDRTELLKLSVWSWGKFVDNLDKYTVKSNSPSLEENSVNSGNIISGVGMQDGSMRNGTDLAVMPDVRETSLFEAALGNVAVVPKSNEQAQALHSALVDMQAQRVLHLKKMEDSDTGYDINVSAEIDRLNKLLKTRSEMNRTGFSLRIEAEGPAGPGFMSNMFGSNVGEKLAETAPESAELTPEENEIFEAELVRE
jgi:hypothetical protein